MSHDFLPGEDPAARRESGLKRRDLIGLVLLAVAAAAIIVVALVVGGGAEVGE